MPFLKNEQYSPEGHIPTAHRSGPGLIIQAPGKDLHTKVEKRPSRTSLLPKPKINRETVLPTGKFKSYSKHKNVWPKTYRRRN